MKRPIPAIASAESGLPLCAAKSNTKKKTFLSARTQALNKTMLVSFLFHAPAEVDAEVGMLTMETTGVIASVENGPLQECVPFQKYLGMKQRVGNAINTTKNVQKLLVNLTLKL